MRDRELKLAELYLPRVPPRWPRARDLVSELGCTLVRGEVVGGYADTECLGFAPQDAVLLKRGRIYYPQKWRLTPTVWGHVAHEAVHYHTGKWTFDDEDPMIPYELELSRRIADTRDRRACYRYLMITMVDTPHGGAVFEDILAHWGRDWQECPTWARMVEACERKRLPRDGRLRGEQVRA